LKKSLHHPQTANADLKAMRRTKTLSHDIFIHPTAIIEEGARLGEGASIGPYCHIGGDVELGANVELSSHVVLAGRTSIGARTRIYPFASLGHPPQDLKYRGEASTLSIGADCLIREGVTMNPGTTAGGMKTIIGDRCTFLAHAHVGHDCRLGSDVILSNNVMLAGHVSVGDFVILGGGAGIIQFTRIGAHAFVGGLSGLENDLIPYGLAVGNRAHLAGLNLVGLKRRGFSREVVKDLRRAYRLLFAPEGTFAERIKDVAEEFATCGEVQAIIDFLREGHDRAICLPVNSHDDGGVSA
jgi:UDP-N-acetylglucosamine acyltransferase